MERAHLHITGIVQGVGMRPFVYRTAVARGIAGWVMNAGDGVHIEAQAPDDATLARFVDDLRANAPAAARIDEIRMTPLPDGNNELDDATFRIVASDEHAQRTTLVSPDIATCPDCLRELFDPADRRYHYPFINCTNCGPRYTIIRALPYDRANTSMDAFPMCDACAREYADPSDRRFHAQPDACFACGPHLTWRARPQGAAVGRGPCEKVPGEGESEDIVLVGTTREASDAIIARCADVLACGGIVAIKGLGGFHLACDASNDEAVRTLRARKRRSNKPLAVMMRTVADARACCEVNETERALLEGTVRPIVLLMRRQAGDGERGNQGGQGERDEQGERTVSTRTIAPSVAFGLPELGVMLPYTPLQHLLLAACAERGVHTLVMTSGNVSEEPIETDDELAWRHLVEQGLADALLGNDRPILSRFDDSVVRVVDSATQIVRRARGYAPRPIALPPMRREGTSKPAPVILACGPEQKATVALTRELADGTAQCLLSQHIGDIENAETLDAWHDARTRLEELFNLKPQALACDQHPGYLSSQWARAEATRTGLSCIEVQHHHAHIASVLAEAAARGALDPGATVLGIALDGTGAGTDGTIWGGELLVARLDAFRRAAHLRPWPLPGGAASVRDARRNALALLHTCGLEQHPAAAEALSSLEPAERALTISMVERGINSPRTSSMGRFLDAVAALLGVAERATYEGEPAIELEAAARRVAADEQAQVNTLAETVAAGFSWDENDTATPDHAGAIDPTQALRALLDARTDGYATPVLAAAVHRAIALMVARVAARLCAREGLSDVALSGGCFMNRLLLTQVRAELETRGLRVLTPCDLPCNDGCIAYGQAAVARARLSAGR